MTRGGFMGGCAWRASMNLRLRRGSSSIMEETEITAFIGLGDFVQEELEVAAVHRTRCGLPGGFALGQFCIAHFKGKRAGGDIERDLVALLHQGERTADRAFGRHMKDARAVAGA